MMPFEPSRLAGTKYIFFTGKGGVGKTTTACATAVHLADGGKNILLVSTDPASNLQDVFELESISTMTTLDAVPRLTLANLDPIQAAEAYKERVLEPYRGKLPEVVLQSMAEQLSGSCTVEIAAFNEFTSLLTNPSLREAYDHILFDTAPTGHTLRMLQLPSAWSQFISENTHGASCLGQLSGLEDKKEIYRRAVDTLSDPNQTTLVLVARPEKAPLAEAARASDELKALGVHNQLLIMNGVLEAPEDPLSTEFIALQQTALTQIPKVLADVETLWVPLKPFNMTGVNQIRAFLDPEWQGKLTGDEAAAHKRGGDTLTELKTDETLNLENVISDLVSKDKRVIFTMGKGGVGKTSIAVKLAEGLRQRGKKVHLTTTDPAAHLKWAVIATESLTLSHIDEEAELEKYREEVLASARETMSEADLAYVEEDLRSPCTQEIAVFRAFAEIVDRADQGQEVVVIDTAPTGHTLLLLDATQSYHREIERSQGDVPESVKRLLPRLRNPEETEVVIVTLAEATPFYEARRLEEDLKRAGILAKWWVINASLAAAKTSSPLLKAKGQYELEWIYRILEHARGAAAVEAWAPQTWQLPDIH